MGHSQEETTGLGVITGSWDGWVSMEVHKVTVAGFLNSMAISGCGGWGVAGMGQEHTLGRWWRDKGVKKKAVIIKVPDLQHDSFRRI